MSMSMFAKELETKGSKYNKWALDLMDTEFRLKRISLPKSSKLYIAMAEDEGDYARVSYYLDIDGLTTVSMVVPLEMRKNQSIEVEEMVGFVNESEEEFAKQFGGEKSLSWGNLDNFIATMYKKGAVYLRKKGGIEPIKTAITENKSASSVNKMQRLYMMLSKVGYNVTLKTDESLGNVLEVGYKGRHFYISPGAIYDVKDSRLVYKKEAGTSLEDLLNSLNRRLRANRGNQQFANDYGYDLYVMNAVSIAFDLRKKGIGSDIVWTQQLKYYIKKAQDELVNQNVRMRAYR